MRVEVETDADNKHAALVTLQEVNESASVLVNALAEGQLDVDVEIRFGQLHITIRQYDEATIVPIITREVVPRER